MHQSQHPSGATSSVPGQTNLLGFLGTIMSTVPKLCCAIELLRYYKHDIYDSIKKDVHMLPSAKKNSFKRKKKKRKLFKPTNRSDHPTNTTPKWHAVFPPISVKVRKTECIHNCRATNFHTSQTLGCHHDVASATSISTPWPSPLKGDLD